MNNSVRHEYIKMLESIECQSDNDKVFIESAIKGFKSIMEASMFVEYHPVYGKMINNEHVPTDNPDSKDPEELCNDIVKWFYMKLEMDSKSQEPLLGDNFFRMVVLNDTPIAYKDHIKIDLSTSPLWMLVKEEATSRLFNSPKYADLSKYYDNERISDDISLKNAKKTGNIPSNLMERTTKRDVMKKKDKIGMHDISQNVDEKSKNDSKLKQQRFSDMEAKMKAKMEKEQLEKKDRFSKLNSLFK